MSHDPNPYAPPQAKLATPPAEKGSAVKAVLLGFLADVGVTLAASFGFVVLLGIYLAVTGRSPEEIGQMLAEPADDSLMMMVLLAIGGLGSLLGGYLCARIARHAELRLGAILAVFSLVVGWILFGQEQSGTITLVSSVISVIATMFGAWIGLRRNRPAG